MDLLLHFCAAMFSARCSHPLPQQCRPLLLCCCCRGDEEADNRSKAAADMAANHLLSTLPSCPRLQVGWCRTLSVRLAA